MSAFSTRDIKREEAEEMVRKCRLIGKRDDVSLMSNEDLDEELHSYVYSNENGKYDDVVGVLYNYCIE